MRQIPYSSPSEMTEGKRERVRVRVRESEQQQFEREIEKVTEHHDTTGWQVVRNKKAARLQRRTDVAKSHMYFAKDAPRTTLFFTNFPENFYAKQMLKAFLYYGEFEEVVIPAKRDKLGKRFGFARAVNVYEPERFVVKLDNIIIGREKLMVNLPRFHRELYEHPKPLPQKPKPVTPKKNETSKPQFIPTNALLKTPTWWPMMVHIVTLLPKTN